MENVISIRLEASLLNKDHDDRAEEEDIRAHDLGCDFRYSNLFITEFEKMFCSFPKKTPKSIFPFFSWCH